MAPHHPPILEHVVEPHVLVLHCVNSSMLYEFTIPYKWNQAS
jgi:hypothetical protein